MHYFFVVQHFQRFSDEGFNNPRPVWFYVVVLAAAALPWSLWAVGALRSWGGQSDEGRVRRLMFVWVVAITIFFTLPKSKLAGYILPVVPPLMYLAAETAARLKQQHVRWASAWRIGGLVAAIACVAGVLLVSKHADRSQAVLGALIRERASADDTIIALDEYRYGLIYEARLQKPLIVSGDWSPRAVASRDNWRRELADAAVFAPKQDWLIANSEVAARVCALGTSWMVGNSNIVSEFLWLNRTEKIATSGELALWHIGPQSPIRRHLCRGKPSANSGARS
jgi:hypothetical protein